MGTVRTPTIPAYVREQAGPLADEMSRLTDAYLQVTPVGPAELQPPPKQIPESVLDVDADPMTVRIFQFSSLSRAKAFARTLVPERSGKKAKANLQGTSKRVGPKVYVGTVAEVPTVSVPRFLHIVSLAEGRPVGAK